MEQIVKPIKPIANQTNEHGVKTPLLTALEVSTAKISSLYNITSHDLANGFYFEYYGVKVPFKVLFNQNEKTHGILGVCFGTAKDCPSRALGLCQLPNDKLCYARSGEARATRKNNSDGSRGMDSYFNGVLCSEFWDEFPLNADLRVRFMDYLDELGVDTLRFNLKGDFRHEHDILCIHHLASSGYNLTGYTARDDFENLLETLGKHPNIILNGSNRKYTNRFKATASLKEYYEAKLPCLGECSTCRKCYTVRGETITVLIHGSGSETELNTPENRKFIEDAFIFNGKPIKLVNEAKGLTTNLNKTLRPIVGESFGDFANSKDVLRFIKKFGGKVTVENMGSA